jgi:TPP-dependent pyruvate/acetoin dehydrogenase alpha subunit
LLVALAVLGFFSSGLWAQEQAQKKQVNSKRAIDADTVKNNLDKLFDQITWLPTVEEAKKEAQKDGKLVFFVHSLGSLTGTT